jgi:hypothetical protein
MAVVIKEKVLRILMEQFPEWSSSPTIFIDFLCLFDYFAYLEGTNAVQFYKVGELSAYGRKLGKLLCEQHKVDLGPYLNLDDLLASYSSSNVFELINQIHANIREEKELLNTLNYAGINSSFETLIQIADTRAIIDIFIEQLQPFAIFI